MRYKNKPKKREVIPQPFYTQIIDGNTTVIYFNPQIPIRVVQEPTKVTVTYRTFFCRHRGKDYLRRVDNTQVSKIPLRYNSNDTVGYIITDYCFLIICTSKES